MKKILSIIFIVFTMASFVYADGWIYDGYNWQYEENGELLVNTYKNIDGVNYYFDTKGNWIPREPVVSLKFKGSEMYKFTMEGKDYNDRKYKTEVSIPMPILTGTNEAEVNEFIKKEFENAIKKFIEERYVNRLFLVPKMEIDEALEVYNVHDVIGIGYIGDLMFNLYIDTKKLEMWAAK